MSEKAREERLKAALRENLRRRKAQARQRSVGGDEATDASTQDKDGGGAATPGPKAPD